MVHDAGKSWKVCTLPNITAGIADVKVFEKKIYILTVKSQHICVWDISAGKLKVFKSNIRIPGDRVLTQLVILDNQLCMRTVLWSSNGDCEMNLFSQLDMTKMVWVKKEEMGKIFLVCGSLECYCG